ncbi:MAG: PASTA domain-containing protein, partial [Desulfovibrionaceae bacterium]|nr:PASTA domain-containing protein [Desulfovibrionaceae bacterium]
IGAKVMTYTGKMSSHNLAAKEQEVVPEPQKEAPKVVLRPFKLAALPAPWDNKEPAWEMGQVKPKVKPEMDLPGKLAKVSKRVPDVKGKSLRNAVELFARAGVVPQLIGTGNLVIKQSPAPGSQWPEEQEDGKYILWLSEK